MVLAIDVIYCVSMFMSMYIEYDTERVIGYIYGIGMLVSVALIFILQLLFNRSALHGWNLFLTFTILGLGGLLFSNTFLVNFGSFSYGVGDGFGYVVILYLLGGAIKRSESLRMFRIACFINFIEYAPLVLGIDLIFAKVDLPNHYVAFAIVLALVCVCVCFSPLLQKRLFAADWMDDYHMIDVGKYEESRIVEVAVARDVLSLTPREKQLFTLMLTDLPPKQIASELRISMGTVNFHSANLYRKLNIQSRAELFHKYSNRQAKNMR
jgi:DNA-binding CsgD family transcriptional regulator